MAECSGARVAGCRSRHGKVRAMESACDHLPTVVTSRSCSFGTRLRSDHGLLRKNRSPADRSEAG